MIGKTVGHYQVIDKIGEGGMGAVYKAEDTTLHRLVALKTLSGHLTEDEEAQERFIREAQSASSLNHPNITTVHEFIEEGDTKLICMEYVEGKTIRDMVESGVVSVRKAIDIIMQAAEALDAAHNKGILHRDVKSANIMVNMEGRVKVMDFGLAHLESRSQLTRTGTTMGTLSYSSPEQISGKPVDKRSEIFSLGVVFYELLTGQLPFRAANEAEILFAIINNEPPKVSKLRDDVPELVEAVVTKMLEKDSEQRYQTCGDVISDLKGIRKEMETSTVGITGVLERVQARSRRRSITIVIAGIVAVAGLVAFYLLILAPKPTGPPRLAVLPFEEIVPSEERSFANGLAIEIRRTLATLSGIDVIQFYGADEYEIAGKPPEQIGGELGVDYLLSATIAQESLANDQIQIRLLPELTRTRDRKILPIETVEGVIGGTDVARVQSELATKVAEALNVTLAPVESEELTEQPEIDQDAFSYYLQGLDHFRMNLDEEHARIAIDLFERATALDSLFADAWAALSRARMWYGWNYGPLAPQIALAKQAVDKALDLNPRLPESYIALGDYYYFGSRDYEMAVDQYEHALALQPNFSKAIEKIGFIRRRQGKWEEAATSLCQALELDPRGHNLLSGLGVTYMFMREYVKSEQILRRAIALYPDISDGYGRLAHLFLLREETQAEAQTFVIEHLQQLYPVAMGYVYNSDRIHLRIFQSYYKSNGILEASDYPLLTQAMFATSQNQPSLARTLYDSVIDIDEPLYNEEPTTSRTFRLGLAHAGIGNKSEAIKYGRQATELLPVSRDALISVRYVYGLAEIYLMVGENDAAIEQLEYLLSIPSDISADLLKIDPIWDPLRGDPRFQELLRNYN